MDSQGRFYRQTGVPAARFGLRRMSMAKSQRTWSLYSDKHICSLLPPIFSSKTRSSKATGSAGGERATA